MRLVSAVGFFTSLFMAAQGAALAADPQGEIKGSATEHTAASSADVMRRAAVVLPAQATGGAPFVGRFEDAPKTGAGKVPVVVFLHGSSGLGLKAIGEWQQWLATQGVASVAPDSFALADRLTYKSPVDKLTYEKIHALRASEIGLAVAALQDSPWADSARLILAGTSEGAISVARHGGSEFAGRMIFSWSCEDNYFVESPRTAMLPAQPVLNVISLVDPYFSPKNTWLGNATASGHCGKALAGSKRATIVLIANAPHTLINLPAARTAVTGFVRDLIGQ